MKLAPALCALLLAFQPVASAMPQGNPPAPLTKKQLEAKAKELVAEGKALEKQGKLAEARDKYVDAEGFTSTGDALNGIHRIDDKEKQQVESILSQARTLYETGKFTDSLQQLQKGLEIQPSNPALHYDLALCYANTGDGPNAALQLDLAIDSLPNNKERTELLELRSSIVMGIPAPTFPGDARDNLASFNARFLQEGRDPGENRTQTVESSLCDQIAALKTEFPANPAILFNTAKCTEEAAQPQDAAQQLANYLQATPFALDRADVQVQQQDLASLASLSGVIGQSVQLHFATAARYLDYRHFDRAITEYEAAEQIQPDFAPTEWQLGILYECLGNVTKARQHLQLYQQMETDAARKSAADAHLSTLDDRHDLYEANVEDAEDILSALLLHAMGIDTEGVKHRAKLTKNEQSHASDRYIMTTMATERFSQPYVQRQLGIAQQDVNAALDIFPLGAEANEMLAIIDLQGNNWPAAYRCYDAVASQNFPVSFYAQVNSAHNSKIVRAAKVEIGSDAIRLVYLTSYNEKKQISEAPKESAGEDDLGNLIVSSDQPPDPNAESLVIHPEDLKGISTDKNFVLLKLRKDQLYLAPLNMLSDAPVEGAAARTFGNEYTRMFIRYLGYEQARLGKEGMTAGEKFKLGFEIAEVGLTIGLTIGTMGVGAPAAYSSAVQAVQIMHALNVYNAVSTGVELANQTRQVVNTMRADMTKLEQASNDDQRVLSGLEFKIIPTQPVPLKFRDKF